MTLAVGDATESTIGVIGSDAGSRLLAAGATIGSGGFNQAVGALSKFGPTIGLSGLAGLADKAIAVVSVMSPSWQDRAHTCELALDLFETFREAAL